VGVGLVGAPNVVKGLNWSATGTLTPLKLATSFGVPISVPSALPPLSPLM
jgi:hypothetical protein